MTSKTASKQDSKTALIQAGIQLMQERGYTATGVQDVLSLLNMPKGSFYHHFDSKEQFAVEIIRHFDQEQTAVIKQSLDNTELTALARLRHHCEAIKQRILAQECRKGCLVGNLSQEMADQSEVLRKELAEVTGRWCDVIAQCIREGQKSGEIRNRSSADALAEVFWEGLNGAIMRAKTIKRIEPLDTFIKVMFDDFLKP